MVSQKDVLILVLGVAMATAGTVDDPCESGNHAVQENVEFRSTGYKMAAGVESRCDRRLVEQWYRIRSKAGEDMPTSCPPEESCGTSHPVWMNGTIPPQDGRIHDRIAATHYNGDCFFTNTAIQVKNCGDFRVYKLPSVDACPTAYCFGEGFICPSGSSSTTGYSPCVDDPCTAGRHTVLDNMESRSAGQPISTNDTTRCDDQLERKWYRIRSKAGEDMPTSCPAAYRCGTENPIWMKGVVPSNDGLIHDRLAATNYEGNCSALTTPIQVKSCGNFRVYHLQSVDACSSSFCFGEGSECPEGYSSESGYTPCRRNGDPCLSTNHTVLNNVEFRSTGYKKAADEISRCDRRLVEQWYRMRSKAGEDMPTSCPPEESCGTSYPVWMNGTIPPDDGEIHDRVAATHFDGKCAVTTTPIQVKNCGTFRVYRLKSLAACPSAYCFGNGSTCPDGYTSDTGYTPCEKRKTTEVQESTPVTSPFPDLSTANGSAHNYTLTDCYSTGPSFKIHLVAICTALVCAIIVGGFIIRYYKRKRVKPSTNYDDLDLPPPYTELPPPVSIYYGDLYFPTNHDYPEKNERPVSAGSGRFSALQVKGI